MSPKIVMTDVRMKVPPVKGSFWETHIVRMDWGDRKTPLEERIPRVVLEQKKESVRREGYLWLSRVTPWVV